MRARVSLLLVFVLALSLMAVPSVAASPGDRWAGPYWGDGNVPPGCLTELHISDCYLMRTGLNALDTPKIDVLVIAPASPTVERDLRIMTQSVQMWAGGIDYLAREMGLDWLADTVEFNIVVDHVDLTQGEVNLSTDPLWFPDIIVIGSNPVGGVGIGIDPLDFFSQLGLVDGQGPCVPVGNPFDFESWSEAEDFDDHHDEGTGTYYVEDCEGAGGNACFAVNGAIDPAPEEVDDETWDNPAVNLPFGLFDLVSHEIGHCLTLGHVGDALDHTSKEVPTFDIMAYTPDPEGMTKCVSTLNVEVFATHMSQYIDVTGDGVVDEDDLLLANDQEGDGMNAFHVQHPDDHWYASSTGSPWGCPQPDQGLVPGEPTQWIPEPARATPDLTITAPDEGPVATSEVNVTGSVHRLFDDLETEATSFEVTAASVAATTSASEPEVHTFEGSFLAAESTGGRHSETVHVHTLEVPEPSTVEVALQISPETTQMMGGSMIDLYVTGAAEGSSADLFASDHRLVFDDVVGTLEMTVDPYLITEPTPVGYILTVTIGYVAPDPGDPSQYHTDETVTLLLDGEELGSQPVRTRRGEIDTFALPATLDDGTHTLVVEWNDRTGLVASDTVTVTVGDTAESATSDPRALPATGGGGPAAVALLLLASAVMAWRRPGGGPSRASLVDQR